MKKESKNRRFWVFEKIQGWLGVWWKNRQFSERVFDIIFKENHFRSPARTKGSCNLSPWLYSRAGWFDFHQMWWSTVIPVLIPEEVGAASDTRHTHTHTHTPMVVDSETLELFCERRRLLALPRPQWVLKILCFAAGNLPAFLHISDITISFNAVATKCCCKCTLWMGRSKEEALLVRILWCAVVVAVNGEEQGRSVVGAHLWCAVVVAVNGGAFCKCPTRKERVVGFMGRPPPILGATLVSPFK